ncbi:4Fe-4S binding protein [bacterium]|nr:4Fe-4S binding protein [bacterium]
MEEKLVLHFPPTLIDKPIISDLVRKYDLHFNILKAYITPEEEGNLVLELKGEEKNLNSAIEELKNMGVKVQSIKSDVKMIEERCIHCTVCIPLCPVGAIYFEKETESVKFNPEKCIACGICIKACPTKAMVLTI